MKAQIRAIWSRRIRGMAVGLVIMVACVSCARIPTSSEVFSSDEVAQERGDSYLRAPGPQSGASPLQIVAGFLTAQSGALTAKSLTEGFQIAQEFLTSDGALDWEPMSKVIVFGNDPIWQIQDEETTAEHVTVSGTAPLVATIDQHGVYTEAQPGTMADLTMELHHVDGQWRIIAAEGLSLSQVNFNRVYRPTVLYFPSQDRQWFVPDLRWFPARNWPTMAVRETLIGPASWLVPVVTTVVPEGTALAIESVPILGSDSIRIQLTDAAAQASRADRALLAQQLQATLAAGTRRSVELATADGLLDVDSSSLAGRPLLVPAPQDPIAVVSGRIVTVTKRGPQPVSWAPDLTGLNPTSLAAPFADSGSRIVARLAEHRLVDASAAHQQMGDLITATALAAPSIDRFDYVWTSTADLPAHLTVIRPDRTAITMLVPWLEQRQVTSVRIAPDGARIAVVSDGIDGVRVDIAGVIRTRSGEPDEMTAPRQVGQALSSAEDIAWAEPTTVAVLGRVNASQEPTVSLVSVGGSMQSTAAIAHPVRLAALGSTSSLIVEDRDHTLWSYGLGSLWTRVVTEAQLPTYPG